MTGQEGEQLGVMTAPEGEGPRNNQGSGRQRGSQMRKKVL